MVPKMTEMKHVSNGLLALATSPHCLCARLIVILVWLTLSWWCGPWWLVLVIRPACRGDFLGGNGFRIGGNNYLCYDLHPAG